MSLRELLEAAGIEQRQLALWGGVSQAMASHWMTGRKPVAAERVLKIAEGSRWRLRPHDLRPDLYPNPLDGLPAVDVMAQPAPLEARLSIPRTDEKAAVCPVFQGMGE